MMTLQLTESKLTFENKAKILLKEFRKYNDFTLTEEQIDQLRINYGINEGVLRWYFDDNHFERPPEKLLGMLELIWDSL